MEFVIRDAIPDDAQDIAEIEKACFSMPWSLHTVLTQMPDDTHSLTVACDSEGKTVGYVGFMYVVDEGYISNVAVRPEQRRQGIADRLIAEAVDSAKRKDLSFLTLEVRESNEPAISLYRKHGFGEVGRRKNYYQKPNEDAILMTLFFKYNEDGADN